VATNMDSYAPFDSGAGANVTESTWRSFMKRPTVSGVLHNTTNEMQVYGDSTGMQVKVKTGEAWIEGHWGALTAEKTLPIAAAHASLTRYDMAVARADFVNNRLEVDILTNTAGTLVLPSVTRNSSIWEIPLSVVKVSPAVSTIAAADVLEARQWGGPPAATVTDDFLLYGDKLSSCQRISVNNDVNISNSFVYFTRFHSLTDQTVTKLRVYPTIVATGSPTFTFRVFRGYRIDLLTTFFDVTMPSMTTGVNTMKEGTFTAVSLRAGETVVVCMHATSQTVELRLAGAFPGVTGGAAELLNPNVLTSMATGFKSGSMPTAIHLTDGSWTKRDRYYWMALA
jgi:hypothetical protein